MNFLPPDWAFSNQTTSASILRSERLENLGLAASLLLQHWNLGAPLFNSNVGKRNRNEGRARWICSCRPFQAVVTSTDTKLQVDETQWKRPKKHIRVHVWVCLPAGSCFSRFRPWFSFCCVAHYPRVWCKNFKMKLNNTPTAICKYILLKDLLMRQPRDQMFSSFFLCKSWPSAALIKLCLHVRRTLCSRALD